MIKFLGLMEVPQYLIDIVDARTPGEHDSFVAGVTIPEMLLEFIEAHGFESAEHTNQALLFSSQVGVQCHSDEHPSIIWVICGTNNHDMAKTGNRSHELICGDENESLRDGGVYYVDTSMKHAVVATNHELWAVITMYVNKEE